MTDFPAIFDSLRRLVACFDGLFVLLFVKILADAFMGRDQSGDAAFNHVCLDDLVRGLDLAILVIGVLVFR